MMPKGPDPVVTLSISNGSNQTYPAILLRKFFAMVFIETGGKKLNIFIATVFGGVADSNKKQDGFPLVNYNEEPNKSCFLNFEFHSKILAPNGCHIENITDDFCSQTDMIKKVWGDADGSGIIEYTNEQDVATKLEELYPNLYQPGKACVSLDPEHCTVYEISKDSSLSHHCLAIKGKYKSLQSGKWGYSLEVPIKVDGLEAINWARAEFTLSENILNQRIRFAIELDAGQTFYTPDFTWYFAPPPGSAINENTASLMLGSNGKEIPNNIQNVRDDTTVLFREWVKLDIEDRRKARVQLKLLDQWQSPFTALSNARRLTVSFETFDSQKENNHQFLVGLILAFILAFCSDKTRINDFYACLQKNCACGSSSGICSCLVFCNGISILAPFVVLITFCAYAYNPKKCLPSSWKDHHHRWWRWLHVLRFISLVSFGVLAVYIFGLWPIATHVIRRFISCSWNKRIIIALFLVNLLVSLLYICMMKLRLKRSPKY